MIAHHSAFIDRNGDEVPVRLTTEWSYEAGQYLEPGHEANGRGRGWCCDAITARNCIDGAEITLTREERDTFRDSFNPTKG